MDTIVIKGYVKLLFCLVLTHFCCLYRTNDDITQNLTSASSIITFVQALQISRSNIIVMSWIFLSAMFRKNLVEHAVFSFSLENDGTLLGKRDIVPAIPS